ncbi:MAG: ribonuclease Z [Anaerolineae bacterium]|nr:ribonuclease Z [Anaerolineae bacterium]
MPKLTILGAAAALPEADRENTYMVVEGEHAAFLIDCAGNPIQRLRRAGISLSRLDGLIATHHHPDHIYGVPLLLLGLWLSQRSKPFHVFAPPRTLRALVTIMDAFEWREWPGFFPVQFHEVSLAVGAPVLDWPDCRVTASPGVHMLPVISLRIESRATGNVLAYCCDTAPSPSLLTLTQDAQTLLHESAGEAPGHSSPAQAAALAAEGKVGRLVLVHYPERARNGERALAEARAVFRGPVELAKEGAVYEF